MAQISNKMFDIRGTFNDMVFAQTKYGTQLRKKGNVDAQRVATDPAFKKTRKAMKQFGMHARIRSLIWNSIRPNNPKEIKWGDNEFHKRLFRKAAQMTRADESSKMGLKGVLDSEWSLVEGLEFNRFKGLSDTLSITPTVSYDPLAGSAQVSLENIIPYSQIGGPESATHAKLIAVIGVMNQNLIYEDKPLYETVEASSEAFELYSTDPQTFAVSLQLEQNTVHPVLIAVGIQFFYNDGTELELLTSKDSHAARILFVHTGGNDV